MENKLYPQWKYKVDFKKVKELMHENWIECFIELRFRVNNLITEIRNFDPADVDLAEELEDWTQDLWFDDKNESIGFGIIKNDDDWEELEFELHSLYDIFDQKKMVWAE